MSADPPISKGFLSFRSHRTCCCVGGRHDECTPTIQEDLHHRLPDSEWAVFAQSAHLPHLEEPQRFREVVEGFLDRVERGAA